MKKFASFTYILLIPDCVNLSFQYAEIYDQIYGYGAIGILKSSLNGDFVITEVSLCFFGTVNGSD